MISGWAGTGFLDSAMLMPSPESKLRLHAGAHPLVRTLSLSVPFPTREIEERIEVFPIDGVNDHQDYGWEIMFRRRDAYGAALVELNPDDFPLLIENCPHVMVASDEAVAEATVESFEPSNPLISFTLEPECVGITVVEE